jgi:hypothetical protein
MLGFENDSFYMIQNNVVFYLSKLCSENLTKKEAFLASIPLAEALCSIVCSFCHNQIILATHVLKIMQKEKTLNALAICYNFTADCKNVEIAFYLLRIFNKYAEENFELKEGLTIFQFCLEKLCNICIFQNDVKTGE